jgi:hypothetical protein
MRGITRVGEDGGVKEATVRDERVTQASNARRCEGRRAALLWGVRALL